ncbi:EamA family transporter [Mycetocola zhadangensis]|uniref:EamA/RhaT family transporter n=1 Tax=Mycetocola zhadangensis TaxID=1164595 RepID=A0A3L7J242_9MICO|nr:EamA family transporter [Mycetocola zhadangensis]RLQ84550.1 EamA/RhaT family transporter [Mycetocola zhadangensis]GGE91965.1 multidrug transporter [Mycetocola zhadangensis]
MLTAIIGLTGALVYGAADFLGGLASKRISPVRVTALSAVSGLVALLLVLALGFGEWSAEAVFWGALSGVSGALAISLLYACLAIGPMSILSPLTAVVSAIVPMTWGLATGDKLALVGYLALGLALIAVVLVGFVPEKGAVRPSSRGILMALGSGTMIGTFLILIDQTPEDSGVVPLILNRAVSAAIMFTVVLVLWMLARRAAPGITLGRPSTGWRPGLTLALACGVIDATANLLLLIGLRIGDLAVMSVLTAMYPAGTILLAALVLKERIAPVQWVGLALALVAAGMLALA